MIKKIKKIKGLGIFSDYLVNSTLPEFSKYNLFYGWNGSGKTTLTNLFESLENGYSQKFPNLEYEIETDIGTFKNGSKFPQLVRVFNQDYITNNIQVLTGRAKSIYILGEENKLIAEQIDIDEKLLNEKSAKINEDNTKILDLEKQKGKMFTDIASLISINTGGLLSRNYRKPDAEKSFELIKEPKILTEKELKIHLLTLKQLEKNCLEELKEIKWIDLENKPITLANVLKEIFEDAKKICLTKIDTIIIERLRINNDLSVWVEKGIELHKIHHSKVCEFCSQPLLEERVKELSKYFNEADLELKSKIDGLIERILNIQYSLNQIRAIDKANLYDELQVSYQSSVKLYETEKQNLLDNLDKIIEILKSKKTKTAELIKFEMDINTVEYTESIKKINDEINKHNDKTKNFKLNKESAQKLLETHYLSSIYNDINKISSKINDYYAEITILNNGDENIPNNIGVLKLKERIDTNRNLISSSYKACNEINKFLEIYLGRNELIFEPSTRKIIENGIQKEIDDGYLIKRNGQIAKYLSEGEKTAIAFVYFIIHLKDQSFDVSNGIVVIDDPISSLDSNSLFQAFSFLKNAVKDAHQVFLLTHNFDFLRLLLNWLKNSNVQGSKSYYMVNNSDSTLGRVAYISILDKDLKDHETEYTYLFKTLYTFKSDGTIASVYNLPNIARKLLDTFLMFRVPNNDNMYKKLETLKDKFNDENKLTAIYKFVNDQSHITGKGFDPCLIPESQKIIKYLLEMIEVTFPEHYKILEEPLKTENNGSSTVPIHP